MTDRDAKLRAVAAHFLGWKPGKACTEAQFVVGDFYCVRHNDQPGHLLPPPDPRVPAVRVALEDAIVTADLWLQIEGHLAGDEDDDQAIWRARIGLGEWYRSDTAADALLDAAYQLTTGEMKWTSTKQSNPT